MAHYKYYVEIEDEEHMLYKEEIIEKYNYEYNLINTYKELTPSKLTSIMSKYCKMYNLEYKKIFFKTKYNLKRVYPYSLYNAAIMEYIRGNIS